MDALTAFVRIADLDIDGWRPLGARKIAEISRWRRREEDLDTAAGPGDTRPLRRDQGAASRYFRHCLAHHLDAAAAELRVDGVQMTQSGTPTTVES